MMKRVTIAFACMFCLLWTSVQSQQGPVIPVLFLNGNGAHATLPRSVTDNLVNATVEGWVRWESLNKWSRVFDFGREGNAAVLQNERENATLFFTIWDRTGKQHRAEGYKVIRTGTWQHMAIVCGKTGMKLYVDGKLVGEDPLKLPFNAISGGKNYIGKSNWPSDGPFHGYIADFRIWSTPRSEAEIRQTMYTQLKGDEPGLAGYWRFDTMEGTISHDVSTSGRHANLIGGATVMNAPGPPISLVSLEPEVAAGIAPIAMHKLLVRAALEDFRIDDQEAHLIESARQAGELAQTEAMAAEKEIRKLLGVGPQSPSEEAYYKALESAHSDGVLSPEESTMLNNMVPNLGISKARAVALESSLPKKAPPQIEAPPAKPSAESYNVLVRTALMDRKIDGNESQLLIQVAKADQLSEEQAQEILSNIQKELGIGPQNEAESAYHKVLQTALADGTLSDSEAAMLQSMQTSLGIAADRAQTLKTDALGALPPQKPAEPTPQESDVILEATEQ